MEWKEALPLLQESHTDVAISVARLAQVHDGDGFFGREFVHELFRRDARNPQRDEESVGERSASR